MTIALFQEESPLRIVIRIETANPYCSDVEPEPGEPAPERDVADSESDPKIGIEIFDDTRRRLRVALKEMR